jgi:hypothetical protein
MKNRNNFVFQQHRQEEEEQQFELYSLETSQSISLRNNIITTTATKDAKLKCF